MPQRPGAFAAQFAPETLSRFKTLCKGQDKAYSKVLERLALLYIETNGAVLDGAPAGLPSPTGQDGKKRQIAVESLQNKLLEDLLKRVEVIEKKEVKTLYELDRFHKELALLKSGLVAPQN
jgi:hypothetical protein